MLVDASAPDADLFAHPRQRQAQQHGRRAQTQLAAQLLFAPFLWVISQAPLVAAYKAITRDT